jgi:hypothetical protein
MTGKNATSNITAPTLFLQVGKEKYACRAFSLSGFRARLGFPVPRAVHSAGCSVPRFRLAIRALLTVLHRLNSARKHRSKENRPPLISLPKGDP